MSSSALRAFGALPGSLRVLLAFFLGALFLLGAMETIYRFQLIDGYRGELESNNRPEDLKNSNQRKTLLIMGDSFAARSDAFAFDLREALEPGGWRTINSAVSGTGIVQADLMAPRRFRRFRPGLFLYEIYVGNDLFDLRYPTGWGRVSPLRSFYWLSSRNFRSLAWLNYKLGQLRAPASSPDASRADTGYRVDRDRFSPGRFTLRDRIYARAEPGMVADSVLLQHERARDFEDYLKDLDKLLDHCRGWECRVILLVIPHFAQLGPQGAERARKIGFSIPDVPAFFSRDYPFVKQLREHLKFSRPGVLLINPLEQFAGAERAGRKLYYRNDSHLNPPGQRFLARMVLRELEGAGFVDREPIDRESRESTARTPFQS